MSARHREELRGIDWTFERRKVFDKSSKKPPRRWRINWYPLFGLLALVASGGWVAAMFWSLYLLARQYVG